MLKPTADFTQIWETINNGHYSMVVQNMADMMGILIVVMLITIFLLALITWLIYRNRKAIKRFFD